MQPQHLDPAPDPFETRRTPILHWVAAAFVVGAAIGIAGVYGMGGFEGNAPEAGKCRDAPEKAARLAPFVKGNVAAFRPTRKAHDLSEVAFGPDGAQPTRLDAWKGRVVLLNVWATWCPPCRAEMPALDRLQARRAHHDFEVVAVSVDKKGPEVPKAYLRDIGARALRDFADPSNGIFRVLSRMSMATGLPTTVLVDRDGCALGSLAGAAEWDGEDAVELIDAAIRLKS
ncbi:MAG: TlpA disulfide reductase family protein [Siculibacillus sp.]